MKYFKENGIEIWNENCLDSLKNISYRSIDLVLTDPPYNIDFSKYETLTEPNSDRKFHNTLELEWNYHDMKSMSELLFKEFERILKSTGSIIIFGSQEWAYYYHEPAIKNGLDLKCTIVWIKSNPIPQLRQANYRSTHENIIWYARYNKEKKPYTFNFISQKEMKNVWTTPILQGSERTEHPTQKPLKIIEKLIQIHSNENDLVLDPFLGSGTTLVACKRLNRNGIGIEISSKYCEISKQRLLQVPKRLSTWLS